MRAGPVLAVRSGLVTSRSRSAAEVNELPVRGISEVMRRLPASVLAVTAVLTLAVPLGLPGGSAAPAEASEPMPVPTAGVKDYHHLAAQVFGAVAVGMPNPRTVQIQHFDAATQGWDAPSVLYRARGRVTCGAIEGRATSPTGPGVALLVACDTPYYEDQAPVHSVALVSRDGRSWSHTRLPGEAYRAPAISPSATYAAWLTGGTGEYVEWSATTGFARPAHTTYSYDSGGETPVVDDTGTVTVIGAETRGRRGGGTCVIGIHARDLAGATTHVQVPDTDPGCTEGAFENVDALTVLGGGFERAAQFTLARAAVGAPWAVTRAAPVDAPGLVQYGYGRNRITTYFLYSAGSDSPIVALGSPDRHSILVQVFDGETQTWGPQTQVYATARRCRDAYLDLPTTAVLYVAELRCGRSHVVLVSPDATTWTVRDVGRRPWMVASGGVALPGATSTTVVGTDAVREFAVTTDGPCEVVQAGRPGELVRLHSRRHGWPAKVQVSTGGAFRTVSGVHQVSGPCRHVTVFEGRLSFSGPHRTREGYLVLVGGTWRFRYLAGSSGD